MIGRLYTSLSIAITILVGFVVLLGYFLNIPFLHSLRDIFLRWFMVLAAVALYLGLGNIIQVHWKKITQGEKGAFYSAALLIALACTFLVGVMFGPTSKWALWIFNHIHMPIESSLMAVLAIVLLYSLIRMVNRRASLFTFIFLGVVIISLGGMITLPWVDTSLLASLRSWITEVLAVGGVRGILLGVALGTAATGLRVLLGVDRPYGG